MVAELSAELTAKLQRAARLLQPSKRICILTGAGISAESGIPTFRDEQTGLWENYRAEDLASPEAFTRNPKLVWSWYQWRRQLVQDKIPNPAHLALARWQQQAIMQNKQLTLITQNVDDLHEQARDHEQAINDQGANHSEHCQRSESVANTITHLHGYLWRNRCHQCNMPFESTIATTPSQPSEPSRPVDHYDDELINCTHCGGYIRPDIVWFGESLPMDAWQTAEDAAANCEVFMSIGTSSLVYPAAGLAQLAKQNGAKIIEINPNPTPNTIVDITLAAKAGVILPLLLEQINELSS